MRIELTLHDLQHECKYSGMELSESNLNRIKEADKEAEEIRKFAPCFVLYNCSEYENENRVRRKAFEFPVIYLSGYSQVTINQVGYGGKKHYSFHCPAYSSLPYVEKRDYTEISGTKPINAIRVLSAKKIAAAAQREVDIFNELKFLSDERRRKCNDFAATLDNLDIVWSNKGYSGRIIRNGLSYEFHINKNNGFIQQTITLNTHENTLGAFLALSNNKYKK